MQGKVDPDEYLVHKPTFAHGHRMVLRRTLGTKQLTMVLAEGPVGSTTKDEPTPPERQERFCLTDCEVITLAAHAMIIEAHYSRRAGHAVPMDIEWAKDADTGRLFIIQARPETVASRKSPTLLETHTMTGTGLVLATGKAVGENVAAGRVRVVTGANDLRHFQPGEVLVAEATIPDWEPVMKTAAAIVTDRGGRTCHAAIVARELGVPAVVGAANATIVLRTGTPRHRRLCRRRDGVVYQGDIPFEVTRTDLAALTMPKIQIMLDLANPDQAFRSAMMPNAGVGLVRMEFIISEQIGNPMALVHPERVPPRERVRIFERVAGFASPREYFVRTLAEGVGTIAAAFYPKPVIVRLSDFKPSEYADLLGGTSFEKHADDTTPSFRGAARYAHPDYAEGFALECEALRRVRDEMGLTNLIVMVPFSRGATEAEQVLAAMARNRLARGRNGLEVYALCEASTDPLKVAALAALFDGFAIGSNNLTYAVPNASGGLGPGVLRRAVAEARRHERRIGLCGEAPDSDVARLAAEIGIDWVTVGPSSLLRTIATVNEAERLPTRAPAPAPV